MCHEKQRRNIRLSWLITVFTCMLLLSACSYSYSEGKQTGSMHMTLDSSNKIKVKEFSVQEGSDYLFEIYAKAKGGKVAVKLEGSERKLFDFNGENLSKKEKFYLEKGVYKITIELMEAEKGEVSVDFRNL